MLKLRLQQQGLEGLQSQQHKKRQPRRLRGRRRKPSRKPKPLLDWLRELAIIDREWRTLGKYGKHVVDKVEKLVTNKPVGMTEVFVSSSMYKMKFGSNKRTTKNK